MRYTTGRPPRTTRQTHPFHSALRTVRVTPVAEVGTVLSLGASSSACSSAVAGAAWEPVGCHTADITQTRRTDHSGKGALASTARKGLTQGELGCCSKIGTTRNTSTSCIKKKKEIKKNLIKLKVGAKETKTKLLMVNVQNSIYMLSLTTTVQTQHVCVCVSLYCVVL